MKTWNAPVVDEMNVQATANGFFSSCTEFCIFTHEHENNKKDDDTNKTDKES